MRHFLSLLDLHCDEVDALFALATTLKRDHYAGRPHRFLEGKTMAMIFDKASTRTRVSFEAGIFQLGGHALFLHADNTQLGRGEPLADSAKVLSRMVDLIMIRTFEHDSIIEFAKHSHVPVINALTDLLHPCQVLTDIFTYQEHRGSIKGKTVTWIGDGNNMLHSWINGAALFGYHLQVASPIGYQADEMLMRDAIGQGAKITFMADPLDAALGADLITTDVWASMGQEQEQEIREKAFVDYQVTAEVMARGNDDALFMHCLPAHRGEEVAAEVIDGSQSVVWDEAENRLHVQKALMVFLMQHAKD
ncbi:MAG: ornithine carbamoyltransferase [Zetaproteobacteria bacterium]|nr:ornithine carbamoyltransferase [Zetaproteobacteria bacterium]